MSALQKALRVLEGRGDLRTLVAYLHGVALLAPSQREALGRAVKPQGGRGVAQVLFYLSPHHRLRCAPRGDWIAEGVVLPFVWLHTPEAPDAHADGLASIATQIKAALGGELRVAVSGWTLHPHHTIKNLWRALGAALNFTFDSGFVSLAAALYLATLDATSSPLIFASAGWHVQHGLTRVEGLGAKIDAIAALQRSPDEPLPTLFVSPQDFYEHEALAAARGVTLRALGGEPGQAQSAKFLDVIKPMLSLLDAAPPADAPLQEHIGYANRPYRDARSYYDAHICAPLARALRDADAARPALMLVFLSKTISVARFMTHLIRPQRLIVLASEQTLASFDKFKWTIQNDDLRIDVDLYPAPIPDDLSAYRAWMTGFLDAEQTARGCVIDLTSGGGAHTALMHQLAHELGGSCVYFSHYYDGVQGRLLYSADPNESKLYRFDPATFSAHI